MPHFQHHPRLDALRLRTRLTRPIRPMSYPELVAEARRVCAMSHEDVYPTIRLEAIEYLRAATAEWFKVLAHLGIHSLLAATRGFS